MSPIKSVIGLALFMLAGGWFGNPGVAADSLARFKGEYRGLIYERGGISHPTAGYVRLRLAQHSVPGNWEMDGKVILGGSSCSLFGSPYDLVGANGASEGWRFDLAGISGGWMDMKFVMHGSIPSVKGSGLHVATSSVATSSLTPLRLRLPCTHLPPPIERSSYEQHRKED